VLLFSNRGALPHSASMGFNRVPVLKLALFWTIAITLHTSPRGRAFSGLRSSCQNTQQPATSVNAARPEVISSIWQSFSCGGKLANANDYPRTTHCQLRQHSRKVWLASLPWMLVELTDRWSPRAVRGGSVSKAFLFCRFRFVGWIEIARVGRTIPRNLHDDSVLVCAGEVVVSSWLRIDAAGRKLLEGFRVETVAITEVPGA
jgi:hypothetical protein